MPGSRSSSTAESPKPLNIFYVWYAELCRRSNTTPLAIVKPPKPKSESVLDFVSDRVKAEEWVPILNALKNDTSLHVIAIRSRIECKFLDDVNTEEKVKAMKRKFGSLWTAFLLNSLLNSLCCCISRTCVLTCLELDGLPMGPEYLLILLESLKKNKTIRILSLRHCPLQDTGCEQLCNCLRYMPNVEILNLTACCIGTHSAECLAKVIRCQQINRYCESWHSSLRYEDPEVGAMAGLKRITLNNNPHIGDDGLELILNELDDDLWIKALDMQRCGVTDNIASRLIDAIDYSRSLEIADFRNNDQLSCVTIDRIFSILKNKQRFGYDSVYQWCLSSTTIPNDTSTYELVTPSYISSQIQKSKSAPFKNPDIRLNNSSDFKLRRTKTFAIINKKPFNKPESNLTQRNLNVAKREAIDLKKQLNLEVTKRAETDFNKKKLQVIKTVARKTKVSGNNSVRNDSEPSSQINSAKDNKLIEIRMPKVSGINKQEAHTRTNDRQIKAKSAVGTRHQKKPVEFLFPTNGSRLAQNLFDNLLTRNAPVCDDSDEEDLLSYYYEAGGGDKPKYRQEVHKTMPKIEEDDQESCSNVSLLRYVQEMSVSKHSTQETHEFEAPKNGYKTCENGKKPNKDVQKALVKAPPVR